MLVKYEFSLTLTKYVDLRNFIVGFKALKTIMV